MGRQAHGGRDRGDLEERPEQGLCRFLLTFSGAACGCRWGPTRGVSIFCQAHGCLCPASQGCRRALAGTWNVVFYTQVASLSVEAGVLRRSDRCLLSGGARLKGFTQESAGGKYINQGKAHTTARVHSRLSNWCAVLVAQWNQLGRTPDQLHQSFWEGPRY